MTCRTCTHGIQKYKCCLGLTDAECANIPSRHCTGLAPDHGTHGPQWIADEIRKAEKMNDEISQAVERFSSYSVMMSLEDGKSITSPDGEWVRYDDYAAISARVAELEAKLAKADAWQEAVFDAHPNIDLDIETKGDSPLS